MSVTLLSQHCNLITLALGQRIGVAMLRVCDGCKDVLDTDQDGASLGPFYAS